MLNNGKSLKKTEIQKDERHTLQKVSGLKEQRTNVKLSKSCQAERHFSILCSSE